MAKKRRSPTQKEYDRMAERILNLDRFNKIQDRDSFDVDYDDYFEEESEFIKDEHKRNKVFNAIRKIKPSISTERIFTEAKGKDLERDRLKTAKTIVTDKETYKKKGASKVDLKGYDVKTPKRKTFDVIGKTKGKIVYARKTFVIVEHKRQIRYRDRLGRFVSVKRKK